ncbi:MAG: methionine--tRNA ligase [Aminobacterium sp.]|jgi:methionyl-tRNA synthetase|nr:methionine--tRNA ligase [Aminobacterium sp.]MDD3425688.1 methionine--tRNA ligase [Aminobacterium sp.]MDD3707104.1 methionine--tRNA ligase [Aminobacterium sp.]MDD4228683.1 methionine--tRNA ligase [Aminobacterium sp.]MDD4551698.1 methionine--tRNA ligase [Aminobacterium sp.]
MSEKSFYITTPIYYVNDIPHIGHAYTTIAADVMARYRRMTGYDVFFCTGTDEHGQKIQQSAEKKGMTAKELADKTMENFRRLWEVLNISNDDFIRTTEERHEKVVQAIFKKLMDQGDIYKGTYEGWYCVPCETYVPESSMGENKTCPDCKRPLQKMEEESYFFRASKYADQLLEYYEKNLKAVMPKSRYNEIVSFIRSGVRDQSVSRTSIKWGIPVPGDEKHVVYVWFDALINYLTACGYMKEDEKIRKFWPNVHHLVGKDIIRFHCVIWPIMLLALGLNPPVSVFAHGWWTVEGEKMSKSKGNVVDPFEMADVYGVDPFRYFVLREVPFGHDGDFSEQAMVQRINSDLANDLGNLLNRTLQMVKNFRDGVIPAHRDFEEVDKEIETLIQTTFSDVEERMSNFAFDDALKVIWALIRRGNKYIDETMPWKLGKEGPQERLDTVFFVLAEILRATGLLVAPFMPWTAEKLWKQLGLEGTPEKHRIPAFSFGSFPAGTLTTKGDVLFPRIDIAKWKEEKAEREAKKGNAPDPGNHEEQIPIDDFAKVELRVGKIVSVEEIPKARKLYKLLVDLGYEKRTIVSGLKEHFTQEELLGKRIIVVVNLKPAKLCGVESRGMLLACGPADKSVLALLTPDKEIPLGCRIS